MRSRIYKDYFADALVKQTPRDEIPSRCMKLYDRNLLLTSSVVFEEAVYAELATNFILHIETG